MDMTARVQPGFNIHRIYVLVHMGMLGYCLPPRIVLLSTAGIVSLARIKVGAHVLIEGKHL